MGKMIESKQVDNPHTQHHPSSHYAIAFKMVLCGKNGSKDDFEAKNAQLQKQVT